MVHPRTSNAEHAPKYKAHTASGATATSGPGGISSPVIALSDLIAGIPTIALPGTWLVGRPVAVETDTFLHPVSRTQVQAHRVMIETVDPMRGSLRVGLALTTGARIPALILGASYAFPVYQAVDPTTGVTFRRLLPGHCIIALDAPPRAEPTPQAAGPLIDPAPALEAPTKPGV